MLGIPRELNKRGFLALEEQAGGEEKEGTEERQGGRGCEGGRGVCMNGLAQSRHSACVHPLPREGQKIRKEGKPRAKERAQAARREETV